MEGHIASVLMSPDVEIEFPAISLLISGGHTELIKINKWGEYEILGQTKDDAIGEAYDKVARMIGISYPGGPEVSIRANKLRVSGATPRFEFPRPMIHSKDLDFSFSGIKTSVLYKIQGLGEIDDDTKDQIAYSFEEAVVEVIIKKTQGALDLIGAKSLIVGGGVIANQYIRESLKKICDKNGIKIYLPEKNLSTDNAVMIGAAGYLKSLRSVPEINMDIRADGNWRVDS
jgi:N6-L-threonylcarbamoyladenine synthase